MKLVTSEQMQKIEAEADARGLTYAEMMRRAGEAVAATVDEELGGSGNVVVLSGPGNNGGDGLVAAAELDELGYDVRVYVWKRTMDGDEQIGELVRRDVKIVRSADDPRQQNLLDWLEGADVVVDALLGTGVDRALDKEPAAILDAVVEAMAFEAPPTVVAVDVPSGLDPDTGAVDEHTVPASLTVTFGFPKVGHYSFPGAAYVGELVHDSIGLADDDPEGELFVSTAAQIEAKLPPRPIGAHKGTFGKALVVGGSVNYTGAPYLAAAAAYRAGCGLVTLAVPGSIHRVVASLIPEATFLILPEDLGVAAKGGAAVVRDHWHRYDAVLLGPGLTTEKASREFLDRLLGEAGFQEDAEAEPIGFHTVGKLRASGKKKADTEADQDRAGNRRLVVDADGLNLLAEREGGPSVLPPFSILTPHPGEMGRLLGTDADAVNANRIGAAREAAKKWDAIVVLKGAFTVVASPDGRTGVNPYANPALATAGTGDILSGLCVGFLAQGMEPFDAALCATFLHGLAGERVATEIGTRGTLASDVLELLPEAMAELEEMV